MQKETSISLCRLEQVLDVKKKRRKQVLRAERTKTIHFPVQTLNKLRAVEERNKCFVQKETSMFFLFQICVEEHGSLV